MNFAGALDALTRGLRVSRDARVRDWARAYQADPGGAPVLVLVPGSTITVTAGRPLGEAVPELVGRAVEYAPHIDIVQGLRVQVWTPRQADLLVEDWMVVP
ncbi:Thoeris anti-defense Tad2 family protein [Actinophytocola sp.]|uniref:Thoeris anti-defense Tad2 family protein n=1 Tax=Actinophytocola sp. TaxID=1872138 RepID=UPI002D52C2FD|nr:hypothetical protein [Actinophytocola sp.]HYQ69065.1 hypothetical protein [Actinophytocola sp.]